MHDPAVSILPPLFYRPSAITPLAGEEVHFPLKFLYVYKIATDRDDGIFAGFHPSLLTASTWWFRFARQKKIPSSDPPRALKPSLRRSFPSIQMISPNARGFKRASRFAFPGHSTTSALTIFVVFKRAIPCFSRKGRVSPLGSAIPPSPMYEDARPLHLSRQNPRAPVHPFPCASGFPGPLQMPDDGVR